ncbi:hypothetical protein BN381_810021 [Candidatus Microthrix parvicella RN1]|uniref:Uncharacterized protein n=1 Tax=Candidatus Neomicrothrix parvicella RN1 TaxID=1229780 RepID=R4Z5B4_9ACTN|nr:hypothetical protein BN381_810021 [Candidatus Microthrix parvicella RN1]
MPPGNISKRMETGYPRADGKDGGQSTSATPPPHTVRDIFKR